jgi:hypothetical protein
VTQNNPPHVPANAATATFIHILPLGAPSATLTFSIVANNGLVSSAPVTATVIVNPAPDSVTITAAEYRTGQQRLILSVTSSVISPTVVLKLQTYAREGGGTYNPDPAAGGLGNVLNNGGAGLYTLTLVGVPRPACRNAPTYATPCTQTPIIVTSNLGGTSAPTALTRIRQ